MAWAMLCNIPHLYGCSRGILGQVLPQTELCVQDKFHLVLHIWVGLHADLYEWCWLSYLPRQDAFCAP